MKTPDPCSWRRAFVLALALACGGGRAFAAGPPRQGTPAPPQAPANPPSAAPAPYEPDLLRLSEIIGALAYLRDLCGDDDGAAWRSKMAGLLQSAGDSSLRRERMAGAYNKGFRDYELIYRSCTPNAKIVISRYLTEGTRLTREISSRYGSG